MSTDRANTRCTHLSRILRDGAPMRGSGASRVTRSKAPSTRVPADAGVDPQLGVQTLMSPASFT
jgi:hypothetical protein